MNDDLLGQAPQPEPPLTERDDHTIGSSTLYRLCEEMIALRENLKRRVEKMEKELPRSFNSFAADTQRAYQQLRQEIHGEKRISLALLNELLEVGLDLEHLVAARPSPDDPAAVAAFIEAVEVENRKVQAALVRHGIQSYDAVIGDKYNPALHERVGSKKVDGMDALRVAEQREPGRASQQPEFVLRRAKVIVSE